MGQDDDNDDDGDDDDDIVDVDTTVKIVAFVRRMAANVGRPCTIDCHLPCVVDATLYRRSCARDMRQEATLMVRSPRVDLLSENTRTFRVHNGANGEAMWKRM